MASAIRKNNIVYSYFMATTKIGDVFYALFNSFVKEDIVLNLNPKINDDLIKKIESAMNDVFPTSKSTISVNQEKNLLNVVWRVCGYTIAGKETAFEKATSYNAEFNSKLESIIANIVAGMMDNPAVPLQLRNPSALLNHLNALKTQLSDRTNNLVNTTADHWAKAFEKLVDLLEDDAFGKALNINNAIGKSAETRATRLTRVAEKVGISLPLASTSFFELAEKLGEFIAKVEDTDWDLTKAGALYEDKDNMYIISDHWATVTGKKFYEEAIALRRT